MIIRKVLVCSRRKITLFSISCSAPSSIFKENLNHKNMNNPSAIAFTTIKNDNVNVIA